MSGHVLLVSLVLALIFTGGVPAPSTSGGPQAVPEKDRRQAGPSDKKDAKLKELLQERLATLRALAKVTTVEYQAGRVSFDRVQQATRAVFDAELEQCESDEARVRVLEKIVAHAKESEKSAVQRYQTGAASQSDTLMATAGRLEAEIALERAKSKPARPK